MNSELKHADGQTDGRADDAIPVHVLFLHIQRIRNVKPKMCCVQALLHEGKQETWKCTSKHSKRQTNVEGSWSALRCSHFV
jgi:hypothetical protein